LIRLHCATGNAGKLSEFQMASASVGRPVSIELLPGFKQLPPVLEDGATFDENAILKARHYGRFLTVAARQEQVAARQEQVAARQEQVAARQGQVAAGNDHGRGLLFADDSGLEVDALNGAPGVYSARFSGPQATDESNNRLLLEKLAGVENRAARFVCAIALVEGTRLVGVYRGVVEGRILHELRGTGGFGYDPLFYCPAFGCTFGEATAEQKFAASHRGQALRAMLAAL
jgi:XTP/dITP diphosphohydrolase